MLLLLAVFLVLMYFRFDIGGGRCEVQEVVQRMSVTLSTMHHGDRLLKTLSQEAGVSRRGKGEIQQVVVIVLSRHLPEVLALGTTRDETVIC